MIRAAQAGELALAIVRRINVRRMLFADPALKAAAVLLAIGLFVWATAIYNAPPPEVTQPFEGRVPIERPAVPAGYVLRAQPGDVAVRLRGPGDAVRAVGQQQLHATLDVSRLAPSPSEQAAPVRVSTADARVVVVEVTPATVPVRFERIAERTLPVQARLANEPPAGFVASPATFEPQQVTVRGPESAAGQVAAVLASVLFGDAPVDLSQDVRPVPVDANGQQVVDVEVDPVSVHVAIPVRSSATTRTVPVLWRLKGDVASGYWISHVETDPLVVTVSGDRGVITGIDRIETVDVDVTGLTAGRTITVPLIVPEGARVVGDARATVTLTVVALTGTRPFPLVAVQPRNVGAGLVATLDPSTVEVVVSGTVPTLAGLSASAVAATVDVAGRGPGTYVLDVAVAVPAEVTVRSVRSARVTVTLTSTTPTPSPSATPVPSAS